MRDDGMQKIVDKIKLLRQKNGLSFQQLADKTGMSKSTLQRYESGDIANIPLSRVQTLAKALHTTPEYLMGWDEIDIDHSLSEELRRLTGSNIKRLRESKDFTQEDLARRIGVQSSEIPKYESGISSVPIDVVRRLSSVLDCQIQDIIGNDGWVEYASLEQNLADRHKKEQLLSAFDELNEVGQKIAIERIQELTKIEDYQRYLPPDPEDA